MHNFSSGNIFWLVAIFKLPVSDKKKKKSPIAPPFIPFDWWSRHEKRKQPPTSDFILTADLMASEKVFLNGRDDVLSKSPSPQADDYKQVNKWIEVQMCCSSASHQTVCRVLPADE